ncbi:hypothetical protein GCM10009814_15320 [Lapillicoccus jejuensis]|uniref:Putative membrane protein DUF2142 n=1 Tax=Lapillicoccus jejuensis TaxID=402171 RepID=A0A542DW61_9MICO|nr:putative membrane protein DUF2142 [Lapillicoccus jejuensis]
MAAVTGLWVALLLGASLLWPPLQGYDEAEHVDMARAYAAAPFAFHDPGGLRISHAMTVLVARVPVDPAITPYSGLPPRPRDERVSFARLDALPGAPSANLNQMVQHPPLAYWLEALVLRAPGVGALTWDAQVWLLRLLSVLLVAPLPALAAATARRLAGADRHAVPTWVPVVAALVPLSLPNLARVGSSAGNDALLFLSTSLVLLGVARLVTRDPGTRTGALVGVGLAVALWTKGLALVLPLVVLVALAWAVAADRGPGGWRDAVRRRAGTIAWVLGGCVVGGSWWLRNLLLFGTVQVDGTNGAGVDPRTPAPPGTVLDFLEGFRHLLLVRTWGGVGLPDLPLPSPLVLWGWPIAVGVALLVGSLVPAARRGGRRRVLLVAVLPVLLVLGVVAAGSLAEYRRSGDTITGAQGRYLYGMAAAVGAGVAVALLRLPALLPERLRAPRAPRRVRAGLLGLLGAVLATTASTWTMLLTSWFVPGSATSPKDLVAGWGVLLDVSPLPPVLTALLVLVVPLLAATYAAAVITARDERVAGGSREGEPGPTPLTAGEPEPAPGVAPGP